MDKATGQSKWIANLSAAIQDTVLWDPSTCPRPSTSSTPNHHSSWAEVVACGRKRHLDRAASPPRLTLSNHNAILLDDFPAPADAPAAPTDPGSDPSPKAAPGDTAPSSPPVASSVHADCHSSVRSDLRPSSRGTTSSARRKIKMSKEAVARRSGGLPRPGSAERSSSSRSDVAVLPQRSPVWTPHPQSATSTQGAETDPVPSSRTSPRPSTPRPLISPTTLIVGDSIIRDIRFFNATTHCFPGATVPDILDRLPGLLRSLPSSTKRVIVHVGTNDTARQQSELTKQDFNDLFKLLSRCGVTIFISGPIATLSRGSGRFSRLLSLHTWLQSACTAHNIGFIDNFNLFWNRSPLFKTDGVHPNRLGSRMLAANLQHAVQSSPHD